jgi:hypothetical protein
MLREGGKMNRRDRLKQLLDDIAGGAIAGVTVRLDWQRQSLTLNSIEVGNLIRTSSHWKFLAALAIRRPRKLGLADGHEDVFPAAGLIGGKKVTNLRREIGRRLPVGVVSLIIQTVPGRGYKIASAVRIPGCEVPLRYSSSADAWVDPASVRHSHSEDQGDSRDKDDVADTCNTGGYRDGE